VASQHASALRASLVSISAFLRTYKLKAIRRSRAAC
jgi:hypothetical protein